MAGGGRAISRADVRLSAVPPRQLDLHRNPGYVVGRLWFFRGPFCQRARDLHFDFSGGRVSRVVCYDSPVYPDLHTKRGAGQPGYDPLHRRIESRNGTRAFIAPVWLFSSSLDDGELMFNHFLPTATNDNPVDLED
jgi:hypothetical protein